MNAAELSRRVIVIFDPDFGERLRDIWPGAAVWIAMSPANAPIVEALWQTRSDKSHLTGITGMTFDPEVVPENWFLDEMGAIDLHHGPYSSAQPYTTLEVIGAMLTEDIRTSLTEYGFSIFNDRENGFVVERSDDEAKRLRSS